ncbi:MAG: T9SS type A sorting domain-containing protein [Bacteroidia bacterium]
MKKAFTLFTALLLAGCLQLSAQGIYNPASVTVTSNGYTNVVFANQPTTISVVVNNPGSVNIPAGDQIDINLSVNNDPGQVAANQTMANALLSLSTTGGFPTGVRSTTVTAASIIGTGRFGTGAAGGGAGGYVHDFTIWPTKPVSASGSSVSVQSGGSVSLDVLYVDAAAFSVSHAGIIGLSNSVNFNQTYPVSISSQNNGIGVSTRPIDFWAKIDNYPAVVLGTVGVQVSVNGTASIPVPNFNLQQLYSQNGIALPSNFKNQAHSLTIYAREQGLENSLTLASYTIPASPSLPVTLASFEGFVENNTINLSWSTVQEQNNAAFVVEKQIANGSFEAIARLEGQGSSDDIQTYFQKDYQPQLGANIYRLRQIDIDGTETILSNQVEVTFTAANTALEVTALPNRFRNVLKLQLVANEAGAGLLEMLDMNGRVMHKAPISLTGGVQLLDVQTANLSSGAYFVRVINGQSFGMCRVIKID